MSNKRINLWLQGIRLLLRNYTKGKNPDYCPFCDVTFCDGCIWRIIEGKDCFGFRDELRFEGLMIYARNLKEWQTARIPMLKRWKKILKAELVRRVK